MGVRRSLYCFSVLIVLSTYESTGASYVVKNKKKLKIFRQMMVVELLNFDTAVEPNE